MSDQDLRLRALELASGPAVCVGRDAESIIKDAESFYNFLKHGYGIGAGTENAG